MKIFTGKVIAKKMPKTATVVVERILIHPLYQKRIKSMRKYHIHDPEDKTKIGDSVHFVAAKPISKLKKWQLIEIEGKKKRSKK